MIHETEKLFGELGVDIEPTEQVSRLKTSQKQLLEISKALFFNARLLILDEPITSLNNEEVAHLFSIVNNLKKNGGEDCHASLKLKGEFRNSGHEYSGKYVSGGADTVCVETGYIC